MTPARPSGNVLAPFSCLINDCQRFPPLLITLYIIQYRTLFAFVCILVQLFQRVLVRMASKAFAVISLLLFGTGESILLFLLCKSFLNTSGYNSLISDHPKPDPPPQKVKWETYVEDTQAKSYTYFMQSVYSFIWHASISKFFAGNF